MNAAPPKGPSKGEKGGAGHPAGGWVRCPTLTSLCLTASSVTTFTGEPNMCPRCGKRVYFGKAVVGAGHVLRAGTWWQEPWGTHQLRGGGRGPWGFIRRGDVPACWLRAGGDPLVPAAAEKVTSLGKDWHRPCLRCERCSKTLTPGGHAEVRAATPGPAPRCCAVPGCATARGQRGSAQRIAQPRGATQCHVSLLPAQHDGQPYCHKPCYGILFGPKGECRGCGAGGRPSCSHHHRCARFSLQASTPEPWAATSTTKTPRRRTSPRRPCSPPAPTSTGAAHGHGAVLSAVSIEPLGSIP